MLCLMPLVVQHKTPELPALIGVRMPYLTQGRRMQPVGIRTCKVPRFVHDPSDISLLTSYQPADVQHVLR